VQLPAEVLTTAGGFFGQVRDFAQVQRAPKRANFSDKQGGAAGNGDVTRHIVIDARYQ